MPPWALAPLSGWVLAIGALHVGGLTEPAGLSPVVNFLAADAFLVAAVLRLFRWRATRARAERGQVVGLAAASLLFPITATLAPWTTDDVHLTPAGVITRGIVLAAVVPLLLSGSPFPGRSWAVTFLGLTEVLRVVGPGLPGGLDGLAPGFVLTAALLLASAAVADFRDGVRANSMHEGALEVQLATTRAHLEHARQAQRERLHDARSAVVGVLGASAALTDERVPLTDRETLQHLMALELARLATVLGIEPTEPVADFALAEALRPVLLLHGLGRPELTWHLADVRALGHPRAVATALDNLLRNAATHAPGAAVRVSTRQRGGSVEITVEDDGPGIPEGERELVLQPGVRGSSATGPGSGLGLSNVASAMAAQGGEVRVDATARGGARVTLVLPAPVPATVAC